MKPNPGKLTSLDAPVHAIWIGNRLSLLEQLTVKLFQKHGYEFHLWLYEPCEGVPVGTIVRDASDILPYSSVFQYRGKPEAGLTNGGIGSLAHWSDQFQLKLLHDEGGLYTQLDVTPLAPLALYADYVFVGAPGQFQTCLMKCPKGSEWAKRTYEQLRAHVNPDTMDRLNWTDSMDYIERAALDSGLDCVHLRPPEFTNGFSFKRKTRPLGSKLIHWWNSTAAETKNSPIEGSFYAQLLSNVGLIPDSGVRLTLSRMKSVLGELYVDIRHFQR